MRFGGDTHTLASISAASVDTQNEVYVLFVLQVLYIVAFIPLLLASAASALLFVVYLVAKKSPYTSERLSEDAFPVVAVQLPLFNEQHVAERLVRAVAAFNYPCQKLHIQVLDDSTDDTTALLAPVIEDVRRQGIQIDLIHREKRVAIKVAPWTTD